VGATLALVPSAVPAQQAPAREAQVSSVAPPAAFADPQRVTRLAGAFPAIDELMRGFAERSHVPGIAYGIIVDGRLVHSGTVGYRDVAARAPVDSATVFRIASMTKSFTAVAILQLRDAGQLSLDDPVERHVPELAALRYPTADSPRITIRHLLTHSTGFPEDNPWGDQQLAATDSAMSRMMTGGIPFSTAPGTSYEYSNFGFAILGRVVANVSGMPYARYVAERVLRPLGMSSTTLQAAEVPADRLAHGYRWQDEAWLEEAQLPDGAFGPMGGMLTSISDLGTWVGFMLDAWPPRDGAPDGPLSRASLREMQQVARYGGASAALDADSGAVALSAGGYGYGLRVGQTCLFNRSVSHGGGLPGFGSHMRWLPEYGVGIIALGNLTYTPWGGVTERTLELLAGTGALQPRVVRPSPVLVERREQVTRLVAGWDDALADSIAAMNLFLDQSSDRRRAAIERLRLDAGGDCRAEGPMIAENALRGRWRMRCATGDLRVAITLAPTEPAMVQSLSVTPLARDDSLEPASACR
ncbi:MAG: serine hydrolase domain-containing protein, partial [Gemmatimonadaceae bacterium]